MESVIYEIRDRIAYVTINRPEAYNACDQPTYDRLAEVWSDFAHNDSAWVAILTGAGDKAFCAGSDIKQNFNSQPEPADSFAAARQGDLMRGLEIWKPVIAAINGHCNGGGLEQALGCDIRIASSNAQFGLGEVLLGLLPGGGGTQRLPRIVGYGIANEMIITGKMIDSSEAYRIGLVNHVVDLSKLESKCEEVANEILKNGPNAVAKSLQCIKDSIGLKLEDGLDLEVDRFSKLFSTDEAREGLSAFVEKRKPKFR